MWDIRGVLGGEASKPFAWLKEILTPDLLLGILQQNRNKDLKVAEERQ